MPGIPANGLVDLFVGSRGKGHGMMSSCMIVSDNLREQFISLNKFLADMMAPSWMDLEETTNL